MGVLNIYDIMLARNVPAYIATRNNVCLKQRHRRQHRGQSLRSMTALLLSRLHLSAIIPAFIVQQRTDHFLGRSPFLHTSHVAWSVCWTHERAVQKQTNPFEMPFVGRADLRTGDQQHLLDGSPDPPCEGALLTKDMCRALRNI